MIYQEAKIFPVWPFHHFTLNAKRILTTKNSGHPFLLVIYGLEPFLSLKIHLIEERKLCRLCLQMADSNAGSLKNWNDISWLFISYFRKWPFNTFIHLYFRHFFKEYFDFYGPQLQKKSNWGLKVKMQFTSIQTHTMCDLVTWWSHDALTIALKLISVEPQRLVVDHNASNMNVAARKVPTHGLFTCHYTCYTPFPWSRMGFY